MSPEAKRIVTAEALEFATGHPAVVQLTGNVEHVTLLGPGEGRADLYLIAPATANTISKIAHGIDDTPVTSFASVALGGGVPMLVVPAMHELMGLNPAVRESLDKLRSWGVGIVSGATVEGENKIASPEEVAAAVLHRIASGPWTGRRVVVIGGAARESLDEVRSLTNESSGASAVALAVQAHFRGADVALWVGALQVPIPPFLHPVPWRSVGDLLTLARDRSAELASAASVLVPAALSDFTVDRSPGRSARPSMLLSRSRCITPRRSSPSCVGSPRARWCSWRSSSSRAAERPGWKKRAAGSGERPRPIGWWPTTLRPWAVPIRTPSSYRPEAPDTGSGRPSSNSPDGCWTRSVGSSPAWPTIHAPAPAQGGSRRHRSIGRRTTRGRAPVPRRSVEGPSRPA